MSWQLPDALQKEILRSLLHFFIYCEKTLCRRLLLGSWQVVQTGFSNTACECFSFSGCLASGLFWPQATAHVEDRDRD